MFIGHFNVLLCAIDAFNNFDLNMAHNVTASSDNKVETTSQ